MSAGRRADAAKWWLIDYLTDWGGEVSAAEGLAAAAAAGFSDTTISGARRLAGVASERSSCGDSRKHIWRLDLSRPQGERPVEIAYALACERPTRMFPEGRTGTRNGYAAHQVAREQACPPCTEASSARSLAYKRSLQPDELARYRKANAEATLRRLMRDPEKRKEEALRYRTSNKAIIRAAKERPCADCEIQYPYYVMQFDHRDAGEKEFNIGNIGPTAGRQKLLDEIDKCEVVCANCHAERTHQRHAEYARQRQRAREAS